MVHVDTGPLPSITHLFCFISGIQQMKDVEKQKCWQEGDGVGTDLELSPNNGVAQLKVGSVGSSVGLQAPRLASVLLI